MAANNTDSREWQASPNGGGWRRIDPPRGETLQQRIDYLRAYRRGDGAPAYRIRCMVAETPLVAAAPDLLKALIDLLDDPQDFLNSHRQAREAITKASTE